MGGEGLPPPGSCSRKCCSHQPGRVEGLSLGGWLSRPVCKHTHAPRAQTQHAQCSAILLTRWHCSQRPAPSCTSPPQREPGIVGWVEGCEGGRKGCQQGVMVMGEGLGLGCTWLDRAVGVGAE